MNTIHLLNKANAADKVIKKVLDYIHGGAEVDLEEPATDKMVTELHKYQSNYLYPEEE